MSKMTESPLAVALFEVFVATESEPTEGQPDRVLGVYTTAELAKNCVRNRAVHLLDADDLKHYCWEGAGSDYEYYYNPKFPDGISWGIYLQKLRGPIS